VTKCKKQFIMKTFIIAALTADGYIGKNAKHAAMWTSKEDKKRFIEITKRAGVIVMGQNTWQTLGKPLKDRLNIVYSPTPHSTLYQEWKSPQKAPPISLQNWNLEVTKKSLFVVAR